MNRILSRIAMASMVLLWMASPALADVIGTLDFKYVGAGAASGDTANYDNITLTLTIDQQSDHEFRFTFSSEFASALTVDANASLTEIYIADGGLVSGISGFETAYSGVNYSVLTGGSFNTSPTYSFAADYNLLADKPGGKVTKSVQWGLNPGQSFSVLVTLGGTYYADDLLAALSGGDFQVGLHVQSFADGGSAKYAGEFGGGGETPEPGTLVLLGSALALGGWRRWRGRRAA